MRIRRVLWFICLALPVVALGGCGAGRSPEASSASAQPAEDVLLFAGDTTTQEAWSQSGVKATVAGIALKTNGHFYQRVVNESDTKTHSFTTNAGVCYQVSAVGLRDGDDIDLALSRDPNPGVNGWKYSMRPPPKWEGFVFRSSQDGTMYVGAHGHNSGPHDGTVEYAIHVRKCQFGTYTKSLRGDDSAMSATTGLTEDVLIWGDEPDGSSVAGVSKPAGLVPKAQLVGIALKTNGHFYTRSTPLSVVTTHSFATQKGVAYQVTVIGVRWGDDPDLHLSRNPEPGSFPWKSSSRAAPLMDGFVFRSSQDGTMYVGVYGAATTIVGATVDYIVQVRKCSFGAFTQ